MFKIKEGITHQNIGGKEFIIDDIQRTQEFEKYYYGKWDVNMPDRYIVKDDAAILFWPDGSKTIVKKAEDDDADPVKAFLWAYFQHMSGMSKTKANRYLRDINNEYYGEELEDDADMTENDKTSVAEMLQNVSNAFSKIAKSKKDEKK